MPRLRPGAVPPLFAQRICRVVRFAASRLQRIVQAHRVPSWVSPAWLPLPSSLPNPIRRLTVHAQCQPSNFPSNHSSAGRTQHSARLTSHFQGESRYSCRCCRQPRSVRLHAKSKERHPICVCPESAAETPLGQLPAPPLPPPPVTGLYHQNHALSCMPLTCFVLAAPLDLHRTLSSVCLVHRQHNSLSRRLRTPAMPICNTTLRPHHNHDPVAT